MKAEWTNKDALTPSEMTCQSSILVINGTPRTCYECSLRRWNVDRLNCTAMDKVIEGDKPEWCPLKPLPSKMKVDYDSISSAEVTDKVVAIGWNACLSTITGETE